MSRGLMGVILAVSALATPALGQSFGGLNVNSVCTDWQRASPSDRHAFIDDLLSGYSMNSRQTSAAISGSKRRVACGRSTLRPAQPAR